MNENSVTETFDLAGLLTNIWCEIRTLKRLAVFLGAEINAALGTFCKLGPSRHLSGD